MFNRTRSVPSNFDQAPGRNGVAEAVRSRDVYAANLNRAVRASQSRLNFADTLARFDHCRIRDPDPLNNVLHRHAVRGQQHDPCPLRQPGPHRRCWQPGLQAWRIIRKIRCCPTHVTDLVKAVLVLIQAS